MSNFDKEHLARLKEVHKSAVQGWVGNVPQAWMSKVGESDLPLPETKFTREELIAFCKIENGRSIKDCCALICAWGGMKRSNGRLFFRSFEELELPLNALRTSSNSRKEDYEILQDLRQKKKMSGADVAYFTKFLFFLRPKQDAYIMDQWTSKSINLLLGHEHIELVSGNFVSTKNSSDKYESFCRCIENLADILGCDGPSAEEKIFSLGGRNPLPWRAHVKKEYSKSGSSFASCQDYTCGI